MKHVWQCEGCGKTHSDNSNIFDCVGCGKETCESCFDRFAHCKMCSKGKTDSDLARAANANNGTYEFEEPANG